MTRRTLASVFEAVGLLGVLVAAVLVDWRLGLAVGGALLVLVGLALDAPRPRTPE